MHTFSGGQFMVYIEARQVSFHQFIIKGPYQSVVANAPKKVLFLTLNTTISF